MEQSRRDLIRKAAVGGGLVWAAPAITSVAHVSAVGVGTPPPTTTTTTDSTTTTTGSTTTTTTAPACVCSGSAFALSASGLIDLGPIGTDSDVDVTVAGLTIDASLLTSSFNSATCTATAEVNSLDVELAGTPVLSATVLQSTVNAPCDCSGGGDAEIASLEVLGAPVDTDVGPNTNISVGPVLGTSVAVVINEQFCEADGQGVARALRFTITALGVNQTIIVAESRAGNDVCDCACCPVSFA